MEESTKLQTLALEPSAFAYSFPRRLLRSRTLYALMPLLPHLRTEYQNSEIQGRSHGVDVRQVRDENGINHDGIKSSDVIAPCLTRSEREDKLIHASVSEKSSENVGCRDGDFVGKQIAQKQLDCMIVVMEEAQQPVPENISITGCMVDDNQTEDCAFLVQGPKDMDDLGSMGPVKLDTEFSLRDFSEVLNSSFDMDVDIELPKGIEVNKESCSVLKENMQKGSEQQLHIMEMELEKLISNPREVDSLSCVDENKEVEEGEISGAAWAADELMDKLSEDVTSLGDKTTRVVYTPEDNVDGKAFPFDEKKRIHWGLDVSNPLAVSVANRGSDCKIEKLSETAIGMPNHFQNVLHDSHTKIHRFGSAAPRSESLPSSGRTILEYTDINQDSPPTDGYDNKKKRKKGPLTKERKAKKKQKERIKRAENNRKLGIKRLKLQPEVKPKTIKYCRHYLQGRCHEGEKCKFSHDTVPLTKSKPCCHFARHSCMKGNDCPFDHELSKYPCNTYSSTGFCNRGSDCLFSHKISTKESPSTTSNVSTPNLKTEKSKMLANEGSSTTLKVSKPSIKLTSPPSNSYFNKNVANNSTPNQKIELKLLSGEKIPDKKKTPKGVSFILPGDITSPKTVNSVVNKSILKTSPVETTPSRPRGINFLSFSQKSSLDDTSSVKLSNLFMKGISGKGKSVVDESVNSDSQQMSQKDQGEVLSGKIQFNDSVNTSKISLLSNTPKEVQKSVQSTLAFAAKFQRNVKLNRTTFVTGATS